MINALMLSIEAAGYLMMHMWYTKTLGPRLRFWSGAAFVGFFSLDTFLVSLLSIPDNMKPLVSVTQNLLVLCMVLFLYKSRLMRKLYSFIILFFIILLMDICTSLLNFNIFGFPLSVLNEETMTAVFAKSVFLPVMLLGVALGFKLWEYFYREEYENKDLIGDYLALFAIFTSQALILLIIYTAGIAGHFSTWSIFLICAFLFFLSDFFLFFLFKRMRARTVLHERLLQAQAVINTQTEKSKEMAAYNERVLKLHHELKNQIQAVQLLIDGGQTVQAGVYISRMADSVSALAFTGYSGHPLIDALLNSKISAAARDGVDISVEITANPEAYSRIDDLHLCSVFSNLIDNAVNACLQLPDNESRHVSVKAATNRGYLFVKVINPCVIATDRQDLSATQYEDRWLHGFGLTILREIAASYEGNLDLFYGDGSFIAIVALRI